MKTVQMAELPKCDICKTQDAKYDTKTVYGCWGYLCETCYKRYGREPSTKLEKRVKIAYKTDKVPVVTVPLTVDSIATVNCPHCNEPRSVEPDANYIVTCDSCDNTYKLVSVI